MKFYDAREWLQSIYSNGPVHNQEFVTELIELLDREPIAEENADAIADLAKLAPDLIANSCERWRLTHWICDRLEMLKNLEDIVRDFGADFVAPNGTEYFDPDDKLRAMLESDRWQKCDLWENGKWQGINLGQTI